MPLFPASPLLSLPGLLLSVSLASSPIVYIFDRAGEWIGLRVGAESVLHEDFLDVLDTLGIEMPE